MKARLVAAAALAVAAAAGARYLFSVSKQLGWLVALAVSVAMLVKILTELPAPQLLSVRLSNAKPLIEVLEELVANLPESGESLRLRLRELLVRRLAARTGLPVAEAEARAAELIKDEVLSNLLKGKLSLRSERDVLEVLERIDRI